LYVQAGAGVRYTSKLDEFDMFVARCKFAALPLTCNATAQQQTQQQQTQASQQQQQQQQGRAPRQQKLVLVEDLPHVGDPERRARVASALRDLATTARCPVVVIATTEEGGGGRGPGGYGSYGAAGAGVTSNGLHKVRK
jgi:ribosome-binding protein aMBF1 (putative translation factor)